MSLIFKFPLFGNHTHAIHPIDDVGSEAVVTACRCGIIFPKCTRQICHLGKKALDVFKQLLVFAVTEKQFQTQVLADDCVGGLPILPFCFRCEIRPFVWDNTFGTEIMKHSLPKLRLFFGRRNITEKCVILTGFRAFS